MTIIINQRAYYIIIHYYVVCCPARLSPNGLTGVKSLMTRIARVFVYIYIILRMAAVMAVYRSRHRVKAVGLHISRTHNANDIRLRNVVLFSRLFLSLLLRGFPSQSPSLSLSLTPSLSVCVRCLSRFVTIAIIFLFVSFTKINDASYVSLKSGRRRV